MQILPGIHKFYPGTRKFYPGHTNFTRSPAKVCPGVATPLGPASLPLVYASFETPAAILQLGSLHALLSMDDVSHTL